MKKVLVAWLTITTLCGIAFTASAQSQGMLFGMTATGGTNGAGVVFSYDPVTGKDSVRFSFKGPNGDYPQGNLIQASNGLLYGLTPSGGIADSGTLFSYNIITGQDSVLVNFTDSIGTYPTGSLIQASNGKLYGTTGKGGQYANGVLFCYNPLTGQDSVLLNFNNTNGNEPVGAPVEAPSGYLYGLTQIGGSNNYGVLYRYNIATGQDTVMINFSWGIGATPYNSPMVARNGRIYGMTLQAGANNTGVIFSHNPVTLQDTFITNLSSSVGNTHRGSLLQANDSLFYGMEESGGTNNTGTLFRYNSITGQDTALVNFTPATGDYPWGTPIQARNGLLYGMTFLGGTNSVGTLFSYSIANGRDSVLLNFNNANGASPYGNLLEAMSYTVAGSDTLPCYGDSAGWVKIIPRGGKMPVTFLWSNGSTYDSISQLKAGTYHCMIKDSNGITFNASVNVIQSALLLANPHVSNACAGNNGMAWLSPSGGTAPYTYLWNNGNTADTISGLSPGTDTCVVTDVHGCSAKGTVIIAIASALKIDSVVTTPTTCDTCADGTATVYVSGGIPPGDTVSYSYLWTYGGDSATVRGIPDGYDAICVTSNYGSACGSVCDSGFVVTGINLLHDKARMVKVYPNPNNGKFNLVVSKEQGVSGAKVEVYNMFGQRVYSKPFNIPNSTFNIDLSSQPAGVYLYRMVSQAGKLIGEGKFVIEK